MFKVFGKDVVVRGDEMQDTFVGIIPGTPEWLNYWIAHPEQQESMLAYAKEKSRQLKNDDSPDDMPIVSADDTKVIAYASSALIHNNWPHLNHRRAHVFIASPDRKYIITRQDSAKMWSSSATKHVKKDENYFKAAVRAIKKQLGHDPFKGRLREIYYDSTPSVLTDYEATKVFEYVIPDMHEVASKKPIKLVRLKDMETFFEDRKTVSGLFRRLLYVAISIGELQWKM